MSQTEARFPVIISLSGWILLLGYLYYNYLQYEQDFVTMLFHPSDYFQTIVHILFLVSPLLSTTVGYAINHRIVLHNKMVSLESHYRDLAAEDLRRLLDSLIVAFANALDAKSPWTKGHSVRVAEYAVAIAEELGLDQDQKESIKIGALLHDIGKLGTYDSILDKAEPLNKEEFELIKKHPAKGVEILSPIKHLEGILPIIRHHHERLDGKGYPDGLQGDEIPIIAKVVCFADSYDAMTSERPYKNALSHENAIGETLKKAGTQFDPTVVDAFIKSLSR